MSISRPEHLPEPIAPQRVIACTARDAAALLAHLPAGPIVRELPGSAEHAYLDGYIVKPWGHELRVYDDRWVDVWRLAIDAGKGTSLHAHPSKDTCLICLAGSGVLETGAGEQIALEQGSVVHIRPGALHRTFTDFGVGLLEVESPRDKFDLVRIDDRYGRGRDGYESGAAAHVETCRLEPLPAHLGPPSARLRRLCTTGHFEFDLEIATPPSRRRHDVIASVSLETSSVLKRELVVFPGAVPRTAQSGGPYLTVCNTNR